MRRRLQEFLKRIDIIYIDNFMCDDINAWKMLFRYYECKTDFSNHDFVSAVVDALEQMPKINKKIRMFIGRKIFAANDSDVKMQYLKERYYSLRPAKRRLEIKQQQKRNSYKDIAKKLYGRDSKVYKRYNLINSVVALISICAAGALLAYGFSLDAEDNNKKQKMTISTEYEIETKYKVRDVYKAIYTKGSPFLSDLSGDGHADMVYYDSDTDEFLVEEYNQDTSDYKLMGNVEDYCNKINPEARPKLFRFFQEDK